MWGFTPLGLLKWFGVRWSSFPLGTSELNPPKIYFVTRLNKTRSYPLHTRRGVVLRDTVGRLNELFSWVR